MDSIGMTFESQMTEENSRRLTEYYLIEAEKLRPSDDLGVALHAVTLNRSGLVLEAIRRLVTALHYDRPSALLGTLADQTATAGYTYCLLQAYAVAFVWNQRVADRVLGIATRTADDIPFPFTGDVPSGESVDTQEVTNALD